MAVERTLSIIKPDAVSRCAIGRICAAIEASNLSIVAARMERLSAALAARFYEAHRGKPFFEPLVRFMASGPVFLMVLSGEGAIARFRELMGATDPAQAHPMTLRRQFGTSIGENAIHGSDSDASAQREVSFFFSESEIVGDGFRDPEAIPG